MGGFFQALQQTGLATAIHDSTLLFPALYTVHIFGVVVLAGAASALDLRLLGVAMREQSSAELAELLLPWARLGFVAQLITGGLLFVAQAGELWHNGPFLLKMTGVALAGVNVLILQGKACRKAEVGGAGAAPAAVKCRAVFSLLCWAGIVAFSRLIAFYQ